MSFPQRPRAVITGAGSGLGRGLALTLASRAPALVLTDIDERSLDETAEAARSAGAEVLTHRLDVTDPTAWETLERFVDAELGGTDILVNNAGVAVAGPVGAVSLEDWRWQIDVNLWGVIYGCHTFVPSMRARASGYILNVASAAGLVSLPEMAPYNVTKSGVVALSRTMRAELSSVGVKVSVLCPTFFQSRIHERMRSTEPRLDGMTATLITGARWTSEHIGEVAWRGLERGKLHILPQLDARIGWRLQRVWPALFQWLLGQLHASAVMDALVARRAKKALSAGAEAPKPPDASA